MQTSLLLLSDVCVCYWSWIVTVESYPPSHKHLPSQVVVASKNTIRIEKIVSTTKFSRSHKKHLGLRRDETGVFGVCFTENLTHKPLYITRKLIAMNSYMDSISSRRHESMH